MRPRFNRCLALSIVLVATASSAALALLPATCSAQIQDGDLEVGLSGGYVSVDRFDITLVNTEVGYFLDPSQQLGGRLGFSRISGDNNTRTLLTGYYSYHIQPAEVAVPFVSIGGGLGDGVALAAVGNPSRSASDFHLALTGGLKVFLASNAALRVEYQYSKIFTEEENLDQHTVLFGFSLFFLGDGR